MYISKPQITNVIDGIFSYGNAIKINRFSQKLYETFPELHKCERLKTYTFLNFALYDYYRCRRTIDRDAELIKDEDRVAGINTKTLNARQIFQGINQRLVKGFNVGDMAKKELKRREKEEIGEIDEDEEVIKDAEDIRDLIGKVSHLCFLTFSLKNQRKKRQISR